MEGGREGGKEGGREGGTDGGREGMDGGRGGEIDSVSIDIDILQRKPCTIHPCLLQKMINKIKETIHHTHILATENDIRYKTYLLQ